MAMAPPSPPARLKVTWLLMRVRVVGADPGSPWALMIPPPEGTRSAPAAVLRRVLFILGAQRLGLRLAEIGDLTIYKRPFGPGMVRSLKRPIRMGSGLGEVITVH